MVPGSLLEVLANRRHSFCFRQIERLPTRSAEPPQLRLHLRSLQPTDNQLLQVLVSVEINISWTKRTRCIKPNQIPRVPAQMPGSDLPGYRILQRVLPEEPGFGAGLYRALELLHRTGDEASRFAKHSILLEKVH